MWRSQYHNRAQLVLDLQRPAPTSPLKVSPKGLVEALADLLLEALDVEGATTKGGENERQNQA